MLQTEFEFTLPRGYIDEHGTLHRQGTMRLATAIDEIEPLQDPRVRANEGYLGIILLSRVVTRLGDLGQPTANVIEQLFSSDFAYLQDLYRRVNEMESSVIETQCPTCGSRFALDLAEEQTNG
ncbi:MAG TPA: hypothetical protein VH591_19525 [Ktedonobacterales bacterium]|jgi:hypothetical protein